MYKRPFTAICQKYGQTKAITVDIPDGKDKALEAAREQLPDQDIIALIPGKHAPNTYTYNAGEDKPYVAVDSGGPWPDNCTPGF